MDFWLNQSRIVRIPVQIRIVGYYHPPVQLVNKFVKVVLSALFVIVSPVICVP